MPNQPHNWSPGDAITASQLNQIKSLLSTVITGGYGIIVKRMGDKVIIESTRQGGCGGGGGASVVWLAYSTST